MRKKLFSAFVIIACALSALVAIQPVAAQVTSQVTAQVTEKAAASKITYTVMTAYEHQGYNSFDPYCTFPLYQCAKKFPLQWTSNSCLAGAQFNWYNNVQGMGGLGLLLPYQISSIKNNSVGCNRIWLRSMDPNVPLFSTCKKPGQGINWFGPGYNDNIAEVGLNRDVATCGY